MAENSEHGQQSAGDPAKEQGEPATSQGPDSPAQSAPAPAPAALPAPGTSGTSGVSNPGAPWRALAFAARDGVIAVASALAVAFVALLVVVYATMSHVTLGIRSIYTFAAVLTGTGLGVPDRTSMGGPLSQMLAATGDSADASSPGATSMSYDVAVELRITVWLLPFLVMTIAYLLSRRAERKIASAEPWRVLLRALVSGLIAALGMLVLALSTHQTQTGLLPPALSGSIPETSTINSLIPNLGAQTGLAVGFVFVGPLLLVFIASLLGRAGVWLRVPSPDRRIERVRTSLAPWVPAARTAWLQARIIGVLAGLVLWIRLFVSAAQDHSTSGHLGVIALAGLLLFLNLSVYGAFVGFGATLTASVGTALSGSLATAGDGSTGPALNLGVLNGSKSGIGLFSEHGQWIVWVLFIAVVIGTVAPVLLGLRWRRFAVRGEDYPLSGFWRPAVLGVLGALLLVLLGPLSADIDADFGVGGMNVSASVGPNFFAALGLTALWLVLGYLATAFIAGSPEPDELEVGEPLAEGENPVTLALFGAGEETIG